jgi:hypothetical protein
MFSYIELLLLCVVDLVERSQRSAVSLHAIGNGVVTNRNTGFSRCVYRSVIPIALASDKMPVITIILFTLKFDEAGKLKIVKTQQLSEEESQKYQHSNRRRTPKDLRGVGKFIR